MRVERVSILDLVSSSRSLRPQLLVRRFLLLLRFLWIALVIYRSIGHFKKEKWEVERTSMIKTAATKDYMDMDMDILDILQQDTLPHLGHIRHKHIPQHPGHIHNKDTLHRDTLLLHTHQQDILVHLLHHIKAKDYGLCCLQSSLVENSMSNDVLFILVHQLLTGHGSHMGAMLAGGAAAAAAAYGMHHMAHGSHHAGHGAYAGHMPGHHGKFKHGKFGKHKHGKHGGKFKKWK
ncbi:hypothetical protein MUK42_11955 [Musa troglodytarum]|uniref:Uncharacterized protein n=1 Tax=Musa troglodytarum TaxID=320322 RepID=A0A9E7GL55_9LILI|nr:hypothetical protein MUK42_11955 [Musa troglodytarum]